MANPGRQHSPRWQVLFSATLLAAIVLLPMDTSHAYDNYGYLGLFVCAGLPARDLITSRFEDLTIDSKEISARREVGITWGMEFLWAFGRKPTNQGLLTGFNLTHCRLTSGIEGTSSGWGTVYIFDIGYLRQWGTAECPFTPGHTNVHTRAGLALVGHAGDIYQPFDVKLSPAISVGVGAAISSTPGSKRVIDLRMYTYYVSFGEKRFSDCDHLQVDLMLTYGFLGMAAGN